MFRETVLQEPPTHSGMPRQSDAARYAKPVPSRRSQQPVHRDARILGGVGVDRADHRHSVGTREPHRRPRIAEERVGGVDHVVAGERPRQLRMPRRNIGMVRKMWIAHQPRRAEHRRQQRIPYRRRQRQFPFFRAVEMHGKVERDREDRRRPRRGAASISHARRRPAYIRDRPARRPSGPVRRAAVGPAATRVCERRFAAPARSSRICSAVAAAAMFMFLFMIIRVVIAT